MKVMGGTEYRIISGFVPVWHGSEVLGTQLGRELINKGLRSGIKINMFRFPQPLGDGSVPIGSLTFKDVRLGKGDDEDTMRENERLLVAHREKSDAALDVIGAFLSKAKLEPAPGAQVPPRRAQSGSSPVTRRRPPVGRVAYSH
jgi:hypothetical protein